MSIPVRSPTSGTTGRPAGNCTIRPGWGNLLLSKVFERAHQDAGARGRVPPFLLFDKAGPGRDVRFRGLLAPGTSRMSGQEDLVAVWRTTRDQRFQNYRATFTVLDELRVSRAWIAQMVAGDALGSECPAAWRHG